VVAVTVDWGIPRFMPGDPVQGLISRIQVQSQETAQAFESFYTQAFGLNVPWWQQYLNFWKALFHGDLGRSVTNYPQPVSEIIFASLPYTLALLVPAILLSFWAGNKVGALAARRKWLDNTVLPTSYALTATPQMWLGIMLAFLFGSVWGIFPISGAYDFSLTPAWSWEFVASFLDHWFLPFCALFLVAFGGWAIGMRNMIIYELEADYAHYLEALGAPRKLVRRYAYRNALLPQVTGLALALGAVVAGAIVVEIVFGYPGLGLETYNAVINRDYFLLQGIFLFIIVGVLIANFIIDIVYVVIDPRTRLGMQGRG
jgi:peptide/nickel transport system permease protein